MKTVKFISGLIIVLSILIALITGSNILFFWSIFNKLQELIMITTGWDILVSKALASIFLLVLVMLPFGKILWSFSSLPLKNKVLYRSLIFIGMAGFFLLSFYASRDTYFNMKTGVAMKYYSLLPNGQYKIYNEPGFDPLTGDSLKKVTKEISLKIEGINPPPPVVKPIEAPIVTPIEAPIEVKKAPVPKKIEIEKPVELVQKTPSKTRASYYNPRPIEEKPVLINKRREQKPIIVEEEEKAVNVILWNKRDCVIKIFFPDNIQMETIDPGCGVKAQLLPGRYLYEGCYGPGYFIVKKNEPFTITFSSKKENETKSEVQDNVYDVRN